MCIFNVCCFFVFLVFSESSPPPSQPPNRSASNVTSKLRALNGTVNANGLSTTAWFHHRLPRRFSNRPSTTQSVSGSSDTTVSIGISGLSSSTTYYYRIAASSSAGTSYGSETSFATATSDTTAPGVVQ